MSREGSETLIGAATAESLGASMSIGGTERGGQRTTGSEESGEDEVEVQHRDHERRKMIAKGAECAVFTTDAYEKGRVG